MNDDLIRQLDFFTSGYTADEMTDDQFNYTVDQMENMGFDRETVADLLREWWMGA